MDLRQLRYFVTVAEELHFGRAAERLYLSPPALSQTIRALERELGEELFVRSPAVGLTPADALLLDHARTVLAQADAAVFAVKALRRGASRALTVGSAGVGASELILSLVRGFRRERPDVTVRLRELDYGGQVAHLVGGRVDAAFVRPPPADERLELTVLGSEPRVAVLPAGHELARAESISTAAILDERFVGLDPAAPRGWREFWWLDEHRRGGGARVGDQRAGSDLELLAAVALDGDVITAPSSLAARGLGGVAAVPLVDAAPSEIAVACRAGDERRHVAAFMRGVARLARPQAAAA